jgi:hypothetical protein
MKHPKQLLTAMVASISHTTYRFHLLFPSFYKQYKMNLEQGYPTIPAKNKNKKKIQLKLTISNL